MARRRAADDPRKEKTLLEAHPGGWVYITEYALGTLLVIPFFLALASLSPSFPLCLLLAAVGVCLIGKGLAAQTCTTYVVTNQRVIVKWGVLSAHRTEIRIRDIRTISCEAGAVERLFGIGTVSIGTAATGGMELRMPGMPSPQSVVNVIGRLRN